MTDEQIIKAVDVCRNPDTCRGCPYHELYTAGCVAMLMKDVFDLINRQKAEIERLKRDVVIHEHVHEESNAAYQILVKQAKSEVIKEFAKRLKSQAYSYSDICGYRSTVVDVAEIDGVLKEMTGEQK